MNAPGRNDPCPCGSGKKYKKCCFGKPGAGGGQAQSSLSQAIGSSIELAVAHQNAGRLQEAAAIYRQVLQWDSRSADALHLLGLIEYQNGKHETAIELISRAIEVAPATPLYYCNAGLVLVALGQRDIAMACYQKALELQPQFAEALNNIGNLLQDQGRFDDADAQYRAALAIKPGFAEAHYNLGNTLRGRGRLQEALDSYRTAIRLRPAYPDAYNNIGVVLAEQKKHQEAVASYQQALALLPDYTEAHNNYGAALEKLGAYDEARKHLLRALEIRPGYADVHCNLGNLERSMGRLEAAIEEYRKALSFKPDYAEAYNNLGGALADLGRNDEAMACYERAAELAPRLATAFNNMAVIYRERGKFGECIAASKRALALQPDFAEPYINIGNALSPLGCFLEAREAYRKALAIEPRHAGAHSNLLFSMLYDSTISPAELHRANLEFAERFEAPFVTAWPRHANSCEPGRRLKIGYVSADFRNHALATFFEPVLANHDESQFEIYCYYNHTIQDHVTDRLRKLADHWTQCSALDDTQLAQRILADGIDILVDLSGHTAGNRLPVFARKPAPIQVTGMGYAGSTGLSAMDYRLTDEFTDPPGLSEAYHSEALVRLPVSAAIFRPDPASPEVNELPVLQGGGFTFACMNNTSKLNERVIALWSRILQAVPGSRLALGNVAATEETGLAEQFSVHGIARERLLLQPRLGVPDYLASHHRFDLGLDTFPYNGGTTTLHSLWMGVPVLTLAGDRTVARAGVSFMSCYGLTQFIATDEEDYLRRAVVLAGNPHELQRVRQSLRTNMASHASCNPLSYTRALETAFHAMWQRWCAGLPRAEEL